MDTCSRCRHIQLLIVKEIHIPHMYVLWMDLQLAVVTCILVKTFGVISVCMPHLVKHEFGICSLTRQLLRPAVLLSLQHRWYC